MNKNRNLIWHRAIL